MKKSPQDAASAPPPADSELAEDRRIYTAVALLGLLVARAGVPLDFKELTGLALDLGDAMAAALRAPKP